MMKRKATAILLVSAMMLTLMGCGGTSLEVTSETGEVTESQTETNTNTESKTEDASKASDANVSASEDSFEYAGKTISMMDDAKNVIDILNSVCTSDPKNSGENVYCYDTVDDQPQISVYTYDKGEGEKVGSIEVIKEEIKTSKGIGIGSSLEDLKAAYGEPYYSEETIERYDYDFGDVVIQFYLRSGKIEYFTYYNADPEYYIR